MFKSKKQKSSKISEITQLGALMEHVDEKVTLLAENYTDINRRLGGVEKTLEHHTEMIGSLMVNMEIIKTDVEFMKNSLKKKVDVDEFATLEKRVAFLESRTLKH